MQYEVGNALQDDPRLKVVIILENSEGVAALVNAVRGKNPRFSELLDEVGEKHPAASEIQEILYKVYGGRPFYKLQCHVTEVGKRLAIGAC